MVRRVPVNEDSLGDDLRALLPSELDPAACWEWRGRHRKEDQRPMLGREVYAYRLIYELLIGPIAGVLHHTCERPWCVNPWHLEDVPQAIHAQTHEIAEYGRRFQASKTMCPRGHVYDNANSWGRQCLVCINEHKQGRKAWLRANGHHASCTKATCRPTCKATDPVGDYHHDWQ
jgi:hypothetical protein